MNSSRLRALGVVSFLIFCGKAVAGDGALWREDAGHATLASGPGRDEPQGSRRFTLDMPLLRSRLALAPDESQVLLRASPLILELPMPDGRQARFRVVESPLMTDRMAERFPEIRTYAGAAVDDAGTSVRFDLTPAGFHAQILSSIGDSYIDPYPGSDAAHYRVYRQAEIRDPSTPQQCQLLTGSRTELPPLSSPVPVRSAVVAASGVLTTHRIAVAATKQYTAHFGGTVIGGLSAVVTTINRVSGIFERELAVRLRLADNNDRIIYTATNPGPIGEFPTDAVLLQNTINNEIGIANYDLGHTFFSGFNSSGALPGIVCGSDKSKAYVGLTEPAGDGFDIAAVAHNIGHQYAANHTYNGNAGACFPPELWVAGAAMEPGSGSTIMAIPRSCPGQNLQHLNDAYFHGHNLAEISTFLAQGGPNNGQQTCGVSSNIGNGPPTVSAPGSFLIPEQTPFQLTASGFDPDAGDVLSYSWEQTDTGLQGPPSENGDNGTAPLFRSFPATASPTRVFPALIYILERANIPPRITIPGAPVAYSPGEFLPNPATEPRALNFMVTARDGHAGGGGIAQATTQVTAVPTAGPFRVINISGPWIAGSTQAVSWNVAGTDQAPLATNQVAIQLSTDGGNQFSTLLASTANDGVEMITVPQLSTLQARIRIHAVDGTGISPGNTWFDVNDSNFVIEGGASPISLGNPVNVAIHQGSPASPLAAVLSLTGGTPPYSLSAETYFPTNPDISFPALQLVGTTVLASAQVSCRLAAPAFPNFRGHGVLVQVTDANGNSGSGSFFVNVSGNLTPTLGSYADTTLSAGESASVSPSQPVGDGNQNLSAVELSQTTLPGGGGLSINFASGAVTIQTQPGTVPGSYPLTVRALDTCGAVALQTFKLQVLGPDTDRIFYSGME